MRLFDLNWLAMESAEADFRPISDSSLIILVGVTGVGKTTTVNALRAAGMTFDLLPNRRALTDALIIAHLQQIDGTPIEQVTDRAQRFALTRRYRELYAGGMAHALTRLSVRGDQMLLFDGLRGVNEVTHAVATLPQARFLVLDAPHFVRLQRLLGRGDAFDTIEGGSEPQSMHQLQTLDQLGVDGIERLFSAEEEARLIRSVQTGEMEADELAGKLKIVAAERANYDPAATIATLQAIAPERTWLFDTNAHTPDEIAQQCIALQSTTKGSL